MKLAINKPANRHSNGLPFADSGLAFLNSINAYIIQAIHIKSVSCW